ncbi:MAG: hypothetical protein JWL58_5186 [Streptosporangiaceae bacterium]|nr:hypothetical protein [Streptosporangiaceae bacterium]
MVLGWVFAGLMTGVAAYHTYRLATASPQRRVRTAHLLMCLGMAMMFAPVGWSCPRAAGVAVYVAVACWCLPSRGLGGHRRHAVTGSLAMAYMFAVPGMPMAGMAGMAMGAGGAYAWISAALAAYFIGETAWGLRTLLLADRPPATDAACHMAVGVAMAYMLLTTG